MFVGTYSGFEGPTALYVDTIGVQLERIGEWGTLNLGSCAALAAHDRTPVVNVARW